jgi:catechol 2,3-dioxygenase-like lactoylglutathione lyase family enzyme
VPLHYVGIRVRNLQRALRFYTRVLGLKVTVRGDFRAAGRGIWVGLQDPRSKVKLELNWYPPNSKYGGRYHPGDALDHIGFVLGNAPSERLEQEHARLLRAGARPTPVTPTTTGGWMFCVRDPDGNWVEVFRWPTAAERRAEQRMISRGSPRRRARSRAGKVT